jgi:hypothetical protein
MCNFVAVKGIASELLGHHFGLSVFMNSLGWETEQKVSALGLQSKTVLSSPRKPLECLTNGKWLSSHNPVEQSRKCS